MCRIMTGTALAYRPPGSILTPEHRPRVTGDYDPWNAGRVIAESVKPRDRLRLEFDRHR